MFREFKWMFTPNLVAVENLPLHTNMQALVVTLNSLELQVDSLNIQLVILHPPILLLSHHWRLEEDSLVLELLCQVEADPPSLISWARQGGGLTARDNVQADNLDSQNHRLTGKHWH